MSNESKKKKEPTRPNSRKQINIYLRPELIARIKAVVRGLPHAVPGSSPSEGSVVESIVSGMTTLDALEALIRERGTKK